jgi:hypothetical protein
MPSAWTLLAGHCSLDTTRWTLLVGHCSLDTARWTLLVGHCSLDTARWTLLAGHCSLDTARWTELWMQALMHHRAFVILSWSTHLPRRLQQQLALQVHARHGALLEEHNVLLPQPEVVALLENIPRVGVRELARHDVPGKRHLCSTAHSSRAVRYASPFPTRAVPASSRASSR